MKKALALASAAVFGLLASACDLNAEQRCALYERGHKLAIQQANGDAGKIAIANIAYAPLKAACHAKGFPIN
jgi:hypothetical protein